MAIAAKKILPESAAENFSDPGFFQGESRKFSPIASGGGKCETNGYAAKRPSAAYLTLPSLETVQELISYEKNIQTPCRILAALNTIFPLNRYLRLSPDPVSLIPIVFQKWLESFMPQIVLDKFNLSLQILPDREVDCELFDCIEEEDIVVQFGLGDFSDRWFPLGGALERYEKEYPGLAKHLLKMLSACPVNLGTPEDVYEMASCYCWYGNDNEREVFEERYADYRESGETEDEARDYARSTILVDSDEFEEHFPEWTFKRSGRQCHYQGPVPPELLRMKQLFDRYRKRKKSEYLFPSVCYPGIIVALDQKTFDFSCEVINRIGEDQAQCGGSYCFSTLAWHFSEKDSRKMKSVFREIRFILEYFGVCAEFLLSHEKEYPHD
ncbi:MAG: hypothetical protein BWY31_03460 [Lentisphaerae bacterium ADurb.Bin242]|nr:MAG: hypothetical protein BWY31_03460 [Lentisphaerae bacterium ADurb.Bin242]